MKEKIKTILYYIFFILGIIIIFSAMIGLLFGDYSQIVSGFLAGVVFLLIARHFKKNQKIKIS